MWTIIESHTVTSLTSSSSPAMAFPNHQCGDFWKRDKSAKATRFEFIAQSLENLRTIHLQSKSKINYMGGAIELEGAQGDRDLNAFRKPYVFKAVRPVIWRQI